MQESNIVEFKREYISDLNKEVVAFANTNGGEIWIGIQDDGTVYGVPDIVQCELQCSQQIANTIKPDISLFIKYDREEREGKAVLKITVEKGTTPPYYIASKGIRPEGVYVRVNSSSVPATESTIFNMIKETTLSFESSRSLQQNLTFNYTDTVFSNASIAFGENQKKTLGVIGRDGLFTNLALLLSDQCVHSIKFAYFEGTQKEVFRDRHEFTGSLFYQLDMLLSTIDRYNTTSSPKITGLERVDNRDYPEEAVREAVINSFVHRDYAFSGYTLVSMFDDRLEIISLGGLMRGVEMKDILMGVSLLRNPQLANIFYRLHLIEAYGTGIAKIKECYQKEKEQPIFECSPNAFKVTLPKLGKGSVSQEVSEKKEKFISFLLEKKAITRNETETLLGISQATAIRLLNELTESGTIEKIGKGRYTKYILASPRE